MASRTEQVVNSSWIARLARFHFDSLAKVRTIIGLEIADADEHVWLRGPEPDEDLTSTLRLLPECVVFDVLDDGRLRPAGSLVPTGRLPALTWEPLIGRMRVELPTAALAGRVGGRAALRFERSSTERAPNLLLTTLAALAAYASEAPEIRLQGCRFAVCSDGRTLVHGARLPPLPGEYFVEEHGVAVPAGWGFGSGVSAAVVAEALRLEPGELAWFAAADRFTRISGGDFVRASRAAVRNSWEVLPHG